MSFTYITQNMVQPASLSADNFTSGFNFASTPSNVFSATSGINSSILNNTNNLSATELTIIRELQLAANQSIRNFDASFGIVLSQSNRNIQMLFRQFNFTLDSGVLRPTTASQQFSWRYQSDLDQTFTVPNNVNYIFAKLWGAGGGAGRAGGWSYGSFGGGGGHTRGIIPVTPGEVLTLVLGRGGLNACWYAPYGGGGYPQQNSDIQYAGLGGGYAGIFRGPASASTAANALLIAGGGGGGGSQTGGWGECADGGAGGGLNGFRGECTRDNQYGWGGTGGTQTAAGNSPSIGGITTGAQFVGGRSNSNSYGGGGGGGWWGGGGGSYTGGGIMGGGGGGSGYVHSSVIFGGTYAGFNQMPAFFWDEDLPSQSYNDATRLAYGGISMQNNIGGCSNSGGHSWITIWVP